MGNERTFIKMVYKEASEILSQLKQGVFAPVYFLQGEEPFFIDQVSDFIEKHALSEQDKTFNQSILYGKEVRLQDVLQVARKYPMMAERQLVLVKEAQEISDLKSSASEDGAIKWLVQYLENPLASTILVFAYKNKTLDGRSKLYKVFAEKSVLLNSKKLYDNQLPDFVIGYTKSMGHAIDPQASQMICAAIGSNMSRLTNEIDKLIINLKSGEKISTQHITQYVGISREYNVFELQKSLASKNNLESMKIALSMASDVKNNNGIMVVSMLFSFFLKVLQLKKSGATNEMEAAKLLGVNPYFAKDYISASRLYSLSQLIVAIHALRQADLRFKGLDGNALETDDIYKELIYQIMH